MPLLTTFASSSIQKYGFILKRIGGIIPGTLWGWGNNQAAVLGTNNLTCRSSPVQIPGNEWTVVAAGAVGSGGVKSDGTLWVWGSNAFGNLGLNDTINRSSPTQIPGTQWSSISAGCCNFLGLKNDNTLWGWGGNSRGQNGDNTATTRSSPVQVPGNQWCFACSNQSEGSFGIKSDGTLWVWGSQAFGQLGNQETTFNGKSSPVQVPGNQWSDIGTGLCYTRALKTDGTLWAWGYGDYFGQLGVSNRNNYDSPVQVPGTSWNKIADGFSCRTGGALKTDGTLWMWGCNYGGQLAQNVAGASSAFCSPRQVPGTEWVCLTLTDQGGKAFKTDGTLWSWGQGNDGANGNNSTCNRSSPVQIPGNEWIDVAGGRCHQFARKNP